MNTPRCVIWEAVSSQKQAKEISPHEQRQINLEHMERYSGKLIADLEVPGHTRDYALFEDARAEIPAYGELFRLIRSSAFDVLICLKRDRLGRTLALIETIVELCRRANILIYETQSPPRDLTLTDNSYAELVTGAFRSASAQHELEELRRRNKMGMFGKFKKGEFLNIVPWGWKATYDERGHRTLTVDERAAQTIRMALITLYLEKGVGATYIGEELNSLGLYSATGKPWTRRTASNIFRMVWRYAGYSEINAYSKGRRRPYARGKGNWPPIITEEELHRVLSEHTARRGKRGVGAAATYRFSLMVYCYYCKTRMGTTYQKRAHGERTIFASCDNKTHLDRNLLVPVIMEKVHEFIELLQDPEAWPLFLHDNEVPSVSEIDAKAELIAEEIVKNEQAMLKADDKLIDGTLDETRHSHQIKRLKERIEHLRHDLTVLDDRRLVIDHAGRRLDRIQEIAARGMEYLHMEDERAANTLLRPLLRIWAKDRQVHRIEIL